MIYIDTANIYSKGRYWCHMVSDTSLEELHQFAQAIPPIYAQHIAEQAIRHIYAAT